MKRLILFLALSFALTIPAFAASTYNIQWIAGLPNARVEAFAVSDNGIVGGWGSKIFVWENGNTTWSPDGYYGGVQSINSKGEIAGYIQTPGNRMYQAYQQIDGEITLLDNPYSRAWDINEKGQVVGQSQSNKATIWHRGQTTYLKTISSNYYDAAYGINNSGQVVGCARREDWRSRPVLWHNGVVQDLGTFGGNESGRANAINDAGQIVGWASQTAFVREKGVLKNIGGMGTFSEATDINESGQIVGFAQWIYPEHRNTALLWENGVALELQQLTLGLGSGDYLARANSINETGYIAGWGYHNGVDHAFLLTPTTPTIPPTSPTSPTTILPSTIKLLLSSP